jgi:hypothetical protein
MNHFARLTNTETEESPNFKWAQKILKYEANRLSALRKLNKEIGYPQINTPIPKYKHVKRPIKLSLRWLLP